MMLDSDIDPRDGPLVAAAERYARNAFGAQLRLGAFEPGGLPHFILDHYRFWHGDLLGQPAVFMGIEPGAAGDVIKHHEVVRRVLNTPLLILLLETITAPLRKRLVENRVAFLVPGAQLFVPEALLELRETHSRTVGPSEHISPTGQVLLIAALQGDDVDDASLTRLAERYQAAVMSMSRALDELEALGIAKPHRVGRQRRLNLACRGGELWRKVEHRLQSPVRKIRLVSGHLPPEELPLAGETALAHYTMLGPPRIERRAAPASVWKRMARHLELKPAWIEDPDRSEVETWSYDPMVLTREPVVDRISLYLSVRNDPDERVAQAAEQLLEPFGW